HTRSKRDWSSDVCSSDLDAAAAFADLGGVETRQAEVAQPLDQAKDGGRLAAAGKAGEQEVVGGSIHPISFPGLALRGRIVSPPRSEERRVGKERRAKRIV